MDSRHYSSDATIPLLIYVRGADKWVSGKVTLPSREQLLKLLNSPRYPIQLLFPEPPCSERASLGIRRILTLMEPGDQRSTCALTDDRSRMKIVLGYASRYRIKRDIDFHATTLNAPLSAVAEARAIRLKGKRGSRCFRDAAGSIISLYVVCSSPCATLIELPGRKVQLRRDLAFHFDA